MPDAVATCCRSSDRHDIRHERLCPNEANLLRLHHLTPRRVRIQSVQQQAWRLGDPASSHVHRDAV